MDILPKLLYVFQTVPLIPPTTFLGQLCKAMRSFICAQKPPRIMIRIMDWFHNRTSKQWVTLEEDSVPIKLKSLPWIGLQFRSGTKDLPFLVSSTLKIWDSLIRKGFLSMHIGPITPLFFNPKFPPTLEYSTFLKLKWMQYHQLNTDIRSLQQTFPLDRP